jgi:hypothetical protein
VNRCMDQRLAEAVGAALRHVPESLQRMAPVDWFLGSDPVAAGLHVWEVSSLAGKSYRDEVGHYVGIAQQEHRPRCVRAPTIVLPSVDRRLYETGERSLRLLGWILHEYGHAVQDASEWGRRTTWVADPVSAYAQTNHHEAFAEAFADWRLPGCRFGHVHKDRATVAHFERLVSEA